MNIDEILPLLIDNGALSSLIPPAKPAFLKPRVNPFLIISDKYHRENLHSDIIKYLLDPKEDHNCSEKFLNIFIDFLGLNVDDFLMPKVSNEKGADGGRMDIFIEGVSESDEKHSIIIENKINDAEDTPRQLPTYYNEVRKHHIVKKIVYLSLEGNKKPSTIGWKDWEVDQILPIIEYVGAYNSEPYDLVNGWLEKCKMAVNDSDIKTFIGHYIELLKFRRGNIMNEDHLNILLNFIKSDEKMDQVDYLLSLYKNIGEIRAKNLKKYWEEHKENPTPFKTCTLWDGSFAVIFGGFIYEDNNIVFTVDFPTDLYTKIKFRVFNYGSNNPLKSGITDILVKYQFVSTNDYGNDYRLDWSEEASRPSNQDVFIKMVTEIQRDIQFLVNPTITIL